jgi:phenylacetate-CoA ligase
MDPDTGQEVAAGQVGENVVTSFANTAQPLLNYRTHDLVRRNAAPCGCGRTWVKFDGAVLGRTDFMVTVRGTNVYQTAVENILNQIQGISMHYELVLTHEDGNDVMTVRFEPDPGLPPDSWPALASQASDLIHAALHVRLRCVPVSPETLPRFELKTKRIIDQRPKELRRALDR